MIRLEGVSRHWPEFSIKNVSLTVREGEYLVIVGPTGAGKTLLLELLLGIHRPDQGRLFLAGNDATALPPEKRGIGMVYQDYLLFPHLNAYQNLAFGLRYRHVPPGQAKAKVAAMASLLGIEHLMHRFPYTLSGGERQRIAIGRALITEPRVLLLDEPFSALDRGTAGRLRSELKSLHQSKNLTTIHVTHDLSEARLMADRMALIKAGELNAVGTPDELLRRPPTLFAANFVGAVNVFQATVETSAGETRFTAGPIIVKTAAMSHHSEQAPTYIMVLPDEVDILPADTPSSPNLISGEVTALIDERNFVTVLLRAPGLPDPLAVHLTRQAVRTLSLEIGCLLTADVRNALHLLRQ
jgi:ABC-type sugar transport system ATPase subunit